MSRDEQKNMVPTTHVLETDPQSDYVGFYVTRNVAGVIHSFNDKPACFRRDPDQNNTIVEQIWMDNGRISRMVKNPDKTPGKPAIIRTGDREVYYRQGVVLLTVFMSNSSTSPPMYELQFERPVPTISNLFTTTYPQNVFVTDGYLFVQNHKNSNGWGWDSWVGYHIQHASTAGTATFTPTGMHDGMWRREDDFQEHSSKFFGADPGDELVQCEFTTAAMPSLTGMTLKIMESTKFTWPVTSSSSDQKDKNKNYGIMDVDVKPASKTLHFTARSCKHNLDPESFGDLWAELRVDPSVIQFTWKMVNNLIHRTGQNKPAVETENRSTQQKTHQFYYEGKNLIDIILNKRGRIERITQAYKATQFFTDDNLRKYRGKNQNKVTIVVARGGAGSAIVQGGVSATTTIDP